MRQFACFVSILFISLVFLIACGKGSRVWDAEKCLLSDPAEGYSMQLPMVGEWVVIDSTGKDDVMFCASNKPIGMAVMLCNFNDDADPSELTVDRVRSHVDKLVTQQQDSNVTYTSPTIAEKKYAGDRSFRFREDILIPVSSEKDTIGIAYVGYIFSKDRKEYGFVVTLSSEIADRHGADILMEIFEGLNME